MSPDYVGLPTWISTENIIRQINDAGYELAGHVEIVEGSKVDNGVKQIAGLVNTYYIPTPIESWTDKSLNVEVAPLVEERRMIYQETIAIRDTIVQAANDVEYYESQGDRSRIKKVQDDTMMRIAKSAESKPNRWGMILDILLKTAIPILFDKVVGIPLGAFVKSILGQFIDPKYL